jgi:drug/metabolite transporter (DMT)-like permease
MDRQTTDRNAFAKGLLLAVPTILIWGVTFVNTKALLSDFSPFEILFVRFLMAYAALWCLKPKRLTVSGWREEAVYAGMGLTGVTVYQFLENCALHWTNASNVCILVSVSPMTTAILSQVLLRERTLTWRFMAGFVLAMVGIVLVCLNGVYVFSFHPVGDLLALSAALSWSVYSVFVTKINARGTDPILMTRRTFFWALVAMLPLLCVALLPGGDVFADGTFAVDFSATTNAARFARPLNLLNLGFLGILASALCFASWNAACARLGTVRATLGIYVLPAITILLAWIFLGERLTPVGALGAALTLAGVVLSDHRP